MKKCSRTPIHHLGTFVVFGAVWSLLISSLSSHWAVNAQYSYGWIVPILCAYLVILRWKSLPPTQPAHSAVATWIFCGVVLLLLPTWLTEQPNPDWRLISWALAAEVVLMTLGAIYIVGGKSWLCHFAFSICFIFTSVPWPDLLERSVIESLTQAATLVTVTLLNVFHITAANHGNLIEVRTGLLGVDEACSGIRSLQAVLPVALFFGEIYRLSLPRRIAVVLCSALIAFLCNVARTFVLSAIAAQNAPEAILSWHDPLGFAAFMLCVGLIWGGVRLTFGPLPGLALSQANARAFPGFPDFITIGLGAWVFVTVVGTEIWYLCHETHGGPLWSVAWQVSKKDFSDIELSKGEADALGCDLRNSAEWTNDDGTHWIGYFFRWNKGPSKSRILARMHRPENCLPAAGYSLRSDRGIITVEVRNYAIPFHVLDFEYQGKPLHVFFCLWEDGLKPSERPRIQDQWDPIAKLKSVIIGKRNLGQQVLEIVISGYKTSEAADAAFHREITGIIQSGA